ncbi:disks large homolog 5-like isoform X2 [Hydractinia symbiolongicarpus]|uniref:disks large homolog 5-like isoform X2 n=1 Tax=Hydractinia symbiolongicarpus TaxID=13093 RepID=UPI00254B3F12|nr:disks large homolog 5-like isoform X2 [Hydractinia symbiolongicarpus]
MSDGLMEEQPTFIIEHQQSDYERLRDQCLSAMSELEPLRRRNAEILNRCEMEAQKADYYCQQHKSATSKLEEQVKEYQLLQAQYEQVIKDRNKYRQDYDEIVLLREQEMDQTEDETLLLNDHHKESDDLKDLQASHDLLSTKYKHVQDEKLRLKEQFDILVGERDSLAIERNTLKQQCASAISGFEKALRDRDESSRELLHAKQQTEFAVRELEQAVKVKIQMSKDIIKLRDERNSAQQEYKLVMSERDTVHQEIEKLQDDLGQTKDKAKKLHDDKEKVFIEKEVLRHEIKAVLDDRDQALKEVHDLKARLQTALKEKETTAKNLEEQRQEYEMLKQERNAAKKERGEAIIHRDQILKECFEVNRIFAKIDSGEYDEIEKLKKQFKILSDELTNAWSKAELYSARRVWAFSERDKVKIELDYLKEQSLKMLKETSKLEEQVKALTVERDCIQQQYKSLLQEVHNGQINKSITSNMNKENMASSQDSAIDTESPSYHIEAVELERASKDQDFGFRIGGGCDMPLKPHDASIFITEIIPGSIAEDKLKVNDCIIRVNSIDVTNIEHQIAYEAISGIDNYLNITILRQSRVGVRSPLQRIEIKSSEEKYIGLSIDSGLHIKRIEPGSAAAEEETLSIGDKILTVNGQSIDNMSYEEAKKLLKTSNLSLTVLKPSVSTTSSRRSLAQIIDDDKLEVHSHNINEKLFNAITTSSVVHTRAPSAPIHTSSHSNYVIDGMVSHNRAGSSFIGRMSDDEIQKILRDLYEEEKRRGLNDMKRTHQSMDDLKTCRDGSFISTSKNDPATHNLQTIQIHSNDAVSGQTRVRPSSSKQSVGSSESVGRHSHLLKKTPTLNDSILEIQNPRTSGQPSSTTASVTSINSTGIRSNKVLRATRLYPNMTIGGRRLSRDPGDRHSSITSLPSFSHRSHSSLGSLNSSEFSDRATLSVYPIEPLVEEPYTHLEEQKKNENKREVSDVKKEETKKSKQTSSIETKVEEEKPRKTIIEKGQNPLGIIIRQGQSNGIFVVGVNEGSVASKVGLRCGDQLLEYNGINLRSANSDQAASIMNQLSVANTVTALVQYNPHKMQEAVETSVSAQSTPCTPHKNVTAASLSSPLLRCTAPGTPVSIHVRINSNTSSCSDHSKLTSNDIKITPIPEGDAVEEPRFIRIDREQPSEPLGIGIIGGNSLGIYISDIQKDSLAGHQSGLKCGDKILKYNAKDMKGCTLEDATLELGKPTEVADFQVQYNPPGYIEAQNEPGDSLYVRTLFDRTHPSKGELAFRKGDILHVTETLYKGQLGIWRATIITDNPDSDEYKKVQGKIPSSRKAEQELLLRRSSTYGDDKLKGRKSLFRRSKKGSSHHAINHSRESSDSKVDMEITSTVSSGTSLAFLTDDFTAYQFVKRYDSNYPRPVVVIGALAEPICDKLVIEYGNSFARCLPEISESTKETMDTMVIDGTYVDYKLSKKGDRYECVTPQAIKNVIYGKSKHCLLDINVEAMEKLSLLQLHPIVIFVKYKSPRHIKEMKEGHYILNKISSKTAKDLYDMYLKVEKDCKSHVTCFLNCHSLHSVCKDIAECVQDQQKRTMWIVEG